MPTATDLRVSAWTRRGWLQRVAAGVTLGPLSLTGRAWAASPPRFAAAWEAGNTNAQADDAGWRIGVLQAGASALSVSASLDVPTRAHGLLREPPGPAGVTLLAVARRPGDWLLRWNPGTAQATWAWGEADRAFNGHVVASANGQRLYTTETDLESGAGLIGVRDAASLEKIAEWPTAGMDPHELLLDADGSLLVANGGIPTLPETGRLKVGLERMDASLVRLDTSDGRLRGHWRVADKRLSLRHIAWGAHAGQRVLGIATQGEHADTQQKREAPVLALFDGRQLRPVQAPQALEGYGGDIAFAGGRFAVSCPRANGVAVYGGDGAWQGFAPLTEACPLAPQIGGGAHIWAGGRSQALSLTSAANARGQALATGEQVRLDNHWLAL